jgi:hypothetical protein
VEVEGMEKQGETDNAAVPITLAESDLSKELIEYLSKEIETVTNGMMVFRSRVSFAVLVGPFLILGTLVYAARDLPGSKHFGWPEALLALVICLCYLTLAFLSGRIEEDGWRQCNVWRGIISELQKNPRTLINNENVRRDEKGIDPVKWMKWSYLIACGLLVIAFVCLLFLLYRMQTPAVAPKPTTTVTIQTS